MIIADDHLEVHSLLRRILEPECDVVEDVFDGRALVDAAGRLLPDLIIVDLYMPVLSGIEAVQRLQGGSRRSAVVFISTDASEENVQRALKVGGRAFVRKASAAEELLPAARAALQEQRFLSRGEPGL